MIFTAETRKIRRVSLRFPFFSAKHLLLVGGIFRYFDKRETKNENWKPANKSVELNNLPTFSFSLLVFGFIAVRFFGLLEKTVLA